MLRYIIRRLLWVALVILVVVFVTFVIFFLMPSGDPALRFAGKGAQPQVLETVRQQLGLDRPWWQQYLSFSGHVLTGDEYGWPGLGFSFATRVPLKSIIFERMWVTMQLAGGAAVVWLLVGIPIGILSALRPRSWMDRVSMTFALIGISAPVFFLGPLALYIFWFKLGWLPGTGYEPLVEGVGPWFNHFILPWCVLAVLYAAFYARMTRANLMETMGEDFIRTARSKGLSERRVVLKHGLRAGLTPIVTIFGLDLAGLLAGAIITETIFNIPGIGQYTILSVRRLDLYAIMDITLIAAFFVTFANLVVDIVYAFLDPRVRYD